LLPLVKTNQLRIFLMTMHVFCDEGDDDWEVYCAEIMKLYEENADLITQDPFEYDRFLKTYCRKVVWKKEYQNLAANLLQRIESTQQLHYITLSRRPETLPRLQKKLTSLKLDYCRCNYVWFTLPQLETRVRHELSLEPRKQDIVNAINVASLISCFYTSGAYHKTLEWVQHFYTLQEAGLRKPLILGVRFYEALSFYRLNQIDLSENKAINLYKTIIEQGYSDDYHKYFCTAVRKLNQWNLKDPNDRKEIMQLADNFSALRKNKDPQYDNYTVVLLPEETLADLLK